MTDWEETTLGDVSEILSAKRVFARDYVDSGVPFWRGKEVVELSAGRDVSTELFISEETYQNLGKKAGFPSAGDILLTSVGTLGRAYRLTPQDRIYFKDGNLTWFRNFSERICPQWLLYWLRSDDGQRALDSSKIGSTQQALTIVNLKKIPFLCPPKIEQEKIAATLSSLDEKIELNRRMNETLEEMARVLFRDWFVDFGPTRRQMDGATDPAAIMGHAFPPEKATTLAPLFPAKLGDDGLPEGWETRDLRSALTLNYGKSLTKKARNPGPFNVFGSGGISGTHDTALAKGPSIIVGRKGTVGSLYWTREDFYAIDTVFYVTSDYPMVFCHRLLETLGLETMNTDAAVPGLNRDNAYRQEFAFGGDALIHAYAEFVGTLTEKSDSNQQENQTLAEMRDLLLPKLMSGEIRLKDAEAAV